MWDPPTDSLPDADALDPVEQLWVKTQLGQRSGLKVQQRFLKFFFCFFFGFQAEPTGQDDL